MVTGIVNATLWRSAVPSEDTVLILVLDYGTGIIVEIVSLITISAVRVSTMHSTDFLFILHDCCSQNRIGGFSGEDRNEGQRPDAIYQSVQ